VTAIADAPAAQDRAQIPEHGLEICGLALEEGQHVHTGRSARTPQRNNVGDLGERQTQPS
jgi:hypothetical protein